MKFDYSELKQKPNNWFEHDLRYYGKGRAEFNNPKGKICGFTEILIEQNGLLSIEMEVEKIESQIEFKLGLVQLLSETKPYEKDGKLSLDFPPKRRNICKKLVVETRKGKFIAHNIKFHSYSFNYSVEQGKKEIVSFFPECAEFLALNSEDKKDTYWIFPLINFVSKFHQYDSRLAFHPLRIYPDALVPDDFPKAEKSHAEFYARQKSKLIIFDYKNDIGFIERLTDYEERIEKLEKNKIPYIITSVMVGKVINKNINADNLFDLLPIFYKDLLSFATGIEVGIPWVEIRDQDGELIKRMHGFISECKYIEGKKVINETICRGTGKLLSKAQTSNEIEKTYFKVAINKTFLSGLHGQTIESKLTHLCLALDALCEHFGISRQNLLNGFNKKSKDEIKRIVKNAVNDLKKIENKGEHQLSVSEKRYLNKIIGRLSNVANTDKDFGLSVCNLLDLHDFPDSYIVDSYFKEEKRKDGIKTWADLLSYYRARVVHIGFFETKNEKHNIDDILIIIDHLHDILTRIILKTLKYDGKYQPLIKNAPNPSMVDWVRPDISVNYLGYKGGLYKKLSKVSIDIKSPNSKKEKLKANN